MGENGLPTVLRLTALEVDDLVALGQELLALVAHGGLDEANPSRSMNDSSGGLEAIPRYTRR